MTSPSDTASRGSARWSGLGVALLFGATLALVVLGALIVPGVVTWSTSGPEDLDVAVCGDDWPCLSFGVGDPPFAGITFPWGESARVLVEARHGDGPPACWDLDDYVVHWDHVRLRFDEGGQLVSWCVGRSCRDGPRRLACGRAWE